MWCFHVKSDVNSTPRYGWCSTRRRVWHKHQNNSANSHVPRLYHYKFEHNNQQVYRTIDTKQDHKQLQQDLNTLVDWSHTWLTFNAAKCHLLKITRKIKFLDFAGLFQELECLVYGMGPILLKCTRDVVVLMK
jgi:hypothetical protein